MSAIAGLALVGFFVLVAAGGICLVFAVVRAPDGREDSSGFHYESKIPVAERAGPDTDHPAEGVEAPMPAGAADYLPSFPGTTRPLPH